MASCLGGIQNKGIIGKGAFGVVYLVENDAGKEFALKVMEWRHADSTEREVAENELKVLKQLDHDNLIVYVDSFLQNGLLYVLTEYCAGGDLGGFLDELGAPVPEDLLLVWLWQMACGLEYMHENDPCILHRDLKPSNIYLTEDGTIRLGDMGIARMLDHPNMMAETFCGTPPYMSPEALREDPYNAKTDMWALGCVVVEMATLDRAYDASSLLLLRDIVMQTRKPLPRPEYGGALDGLVTRMLTIDPDARISSAELLDEWAMKDVEESGKKPVDLLRKHNLLRFLAVHRRADPKSTGTKAGEEDTVYTLTPSVSNLKQILNDGETMTSYHYKVEHRIRGRRRDSTLKPACRTVIHQPAQTQKTKTAKKKVSLSPSDSSEKIELPISFDSRSIRDTVSQRCVSTVKSTIRTPRQITPTFSATGSNLSRSTIISTLRSVLTQALGQESFDSAVTMVGASSDRQDLVANLQGLLGTDQFQSIGGAVTLLVLMTLMDSRGGSS